MKLFYLALNSINKKLIMPLRDWKAAVTLANLTKDRMPKD